MNRLLFLLLPMIPLMASATTLEYLIARNATGSVQDVTQMGIHRYAVQGMSPAVVWLPLEKRETLSWVNNGLVDQSPAVDTPALLPRTDAMTPTPGQVVFRLQHLDVVTYMPSTGAPVRHPRIPVVTR
ncbi:hypothetical protein H6771_01000 [Candidatus Peribacteria bacterium]|nr:hypothetical protein [Candidatus Peribacteria bacterium]